MSEGGYESYLPSIRDSFSRGSASSSIHEEPRVGMYGAIYGYLERHPGVFHFLHAHESTLMRINRVFSSPQIQGITDGIIDTVHNTGYALINPYKNIVVPAASFLKDTFILMNSDSLPDHYSEQAAMNMGNRWQNSVVTPYNNIFHGDSYTSWHTMSSLGMSSLISFGVTPIAKTIGKSAIVATERFSEIRFFGSRTTSNLSNPRVQLEARIEASRAARNSSGFSTFSKRAEAIEFYAQSGFSYETTLNHISGIDFNFAVQKVIVREGTELSQYMFPTQIKPGNYYTLPNIPGNQLGIYT